MTPIDVTFAIGGRSVTKTITLSWTPEPQAIDAIEESEHLFALDPGPGLDALLRSAIAKLLSEALTEDFIAKALSEILP